MQVSFWYYIRLVLYLYPGAIFGERDPAERDLKWQTLNQLVTLKAIFSIEGGILTPQKTFVTFARKVAFGLGQTHRSTAFSSACIVERQTDHDLYIILIFVSSLKLSSLNELEG